MQFTCQPVRNDEGDPCLSCSTGHLVLYLPGSCYCSACRMPPCGNCESSFFACDNPKCQEPAHGYDDEPTWSPDWVRV